MKIFTIETDDTPEGKKVSITFDSTPIDRDKFAWVIGVIVSMVAATFFLILANILH